MCRLVWRLSEFAFFVRLLRWAHFLFFRVVIMASNSFIINQRVARYRKLKDLNQTQMADFMGIKTSTYSQKERKGKITAEEIVKIADILNINVNALLYGEVEKINTSANPNEIEQKIRSEYASRYAFFEKLTPKNISHIKIIFSLRPKQRQEVFDLAYKFYLNNKKSTS